MKSCGYWRCFLYLLDQMPTVMASDLVVRELGELVDTNGKALPPASV
ncbi:hypothetical protein [Candidatus Protofrankia californiensis]|nr:hypothetical protein [Candidatus Protofrankia californiensis]